ncbi:MAG: hypothetical protein WCK46_01360 [Candidatus Adlerbacteria bacterium]
MKGALLIGFALLIDGAQAFTAFTFFVMGAFPGTAGGGIAGCLLGSTFFGGKIGCFLVGTITSVAGSLVNPVLAPIALPFAIALGFGISFCIDVTLGAILLASLWSFGMYYPKYAGAGLLLEMLPGLSNLPGWTCMTTLAVIRKKAEEKKLEGTAGEAFSKRMTSGLTGAGATTIFGLNQATQKLARERGVYTQEEQNTADSKTKSTVSTELRNIDGIRAPRTQSSSNLTPYAA